MDGMGWLLEKRCLLMSTYHQPDEYFTENMPGSRSWAMWVWATANRNTVFGVLSEPSGQQYIGAEADRILKEGRMKSHH